LNKKIKIGLTVGLFLILTLTVFSVNAAINFPDRDDGDKIKAVIAFERNIDFDLLSRARASVQYEFQTFSAVKALISSDALNSLSYNPKISFVEGSIPVQLYEDTLDWGVDRVDADIVWGGSDGAVDVTTSVAGDSVKVVVIDTGIDYTHPDLAGAYAGGYDFVNDDDDPLDDHGHGTHVSGTITALDDEPNALSGSLIGTAPHVQLYSVKVLDNRGSGSSADVAAGIDWAAANGMNVASLSLGSSSPSTAIETAGQNAYAAGVLLVAASGNDGAEVGYPAAFPEFIAVGATDQQDALASFSNFGPEQELVAPGVDITSTTPTYKVGNGIFSPSLNYDTWSGTSMATPHVSGVAALVYSADTSLTNVEVRDILQKSAEDLGPAGWDPDFVYGIVDAEAAVSLVSVGGSTDDTTPPAQVTGLTASAVSDTQIDLSWDANSESDLSYYKIYRDGAYVADATTNSYSDTGLTASTTYTYEVSAVDTSGNEGAKSDPASATTLESSGTSSVMYVSDISFVEQLEGGFPFGTYYTYATVTVVDGDGNALEGVAVSVTIEYPDGSTITASGTTDANGQVVFKYESNACGTYTLYVDSLAKDGYTWDSTLGLTQASFTNC
jgi:subtilisin family serine protease